MPETTENDPQSFDDWIDMLTEYQMPIFFNTAQRVHAVISDERKGTMELASVIMQDPNLTVKLLKLACSVYYNPTRQKIITVSRAILILGSKMIHEITLVCSFFDSIASSINKTQVENVIAQAIHAAMQAKALAIAAKDASPEEVFIAALLRHIGKISFWCFCGQQGERILSLMDQQGYTADAAEKAVLGFKVSDLDAPLSKAWKLGGLIEAAAVKFPASKNPRVKIIELGYEITEALMTQGDAKKLSACVKKVQEITHQPEKTVLDHIRQHTEMAADVVRQLSGAHHALTWLGEDLSITDDANQPAPVLDKQQLQLQIAQEITTIINNDKLDINLLFETVLESIKRGVGMDRAVFALLAADQHSLYEKLSVGWHKDVSQKIVFNLSNTPPNLFFYALHGSRAQRLKPSTDAALYTHNDINVIGKTECFIMPVFSNDKPTGIIYADRSISRQTLTDEDFSAFKYFAQQANLGLSIYRMQKNLR